MKLKEFIEDLTKEMKENNWGNKDIIFITSARKNLSYLSIYKKNKNVYIDIGGKNE